MKIVIKSKYRVLFLLFFSLQLFAVESAPMKYIDRGACPYECCSYEAWSVMTKTQLKESSSASSPVIAIIDTKDVIKSVKGKVITYSPGEISIMHDTLSEHSHKTYVQNTKLFVYAEKGEGFFTVWFEGEFYTEYIPFLFGWSSCTEENSCWGKVEYLPKSTWWVKITTTDGKSGWTKEMHHFKNENGCG